MNKRGQMTWGHILAMVVVVVLVLFFLYFIKSYIVDPSNSLSSCENHGGVCQSAPCHSVKQWPMTYSCKEKNERCCLYRDGYNKETEDILSQGGSGTEVKDGNSMFVYTKEAGEEETQKIVSSKEEFPLSDKEYNYYFAAEGKDVGVCYASIMYFENREGSKKVWRVNGQEVRVRMNKDVCETIGTAKTPLKFKFDNESYKNHKFQLEFLVFPKDWGETVAKFQADATKNGVWEKPEEWVGKFVKPITIGDPTCDYYDKLPADKKEIACMGNNDCVWCPANKDCLTVKDNNEMKTCEDNCHPNPVNNNYLLTYNYDKRKKTCSPNKETCKELLQLEYDYTDDDDITIFCSPKECCGNKIEFMFLNDKDNNSNIFCGNSYLYGFANDMRVALRPSLVDSHYGKCVFPIGINILKIKIDEANKIDYTRIPPDNVFYHYKYKDYI